MAKSFSELQTLAIQIRDELNKKKNSAQRVGSALLDIIDNCIQNITDIKQKLSVFEHACSGFKRVSSEAQLPVTPSQEDLAKGFLVNTSLYLYVGTGGNAVNGRYFNVGDIRGPQGEPGSKGETGNTGPTGEKGEQGNSGVTGDTSDIVVINNLDGGESEEGSIKVLAAEQGKVLNKKFTEFSGESLYCPMLALSRKITLNIGSDYNSGTDITYDLKAKHKYYIRIISNEAVFNSLSILDTGYGYLIKEVPYTENYIEFAPAIDRTSLGLMVKGADITKGGDIYIALYEAEDGIISNVINAGKDITSIQDEIKTINNAIYTQKQLNPTVDDGKLINAEGEITSNGGWELNVYPINEGDEITIKGDTYGYCTIYAFYGDNIQDDSLILKGKVVTSGDKYSIDISAIAPEGTKAVVISRYKQYEAPVLWVTVPVKTLVDDVATQLAQLSNDITNTLGLHFYPDFEYSINTENYYLDISTRSLKEVSGYFVSDRIDVKKGDVYIIKTKNLSVNFALISYIKTDYSKSRCVVQGKREQTEYVFIADEDGQVVLCANKGAVMLKYSSDVIASTQPSEQYNYIVHFDTDGFKVYTRFNNEYNILYIFKENGPNKLFQLSSYTLKATDYPDKILLMKQFYGTGVSTDETISPWRVKAVNNPVNDDIGFTGGFHTYNDGDLEYPSASTISYKIYADEEIINQGTEKKCNKIKIEVIDHLQAYNTYKSSEHTGRDVIEIKETYMLNGDGKIHIQSIFKALEDVDIYTHYGIQTVYFTPYSIFITDKGIIEKNMAEVSNYYHKGRVNSMIGKKDDGMMEVVHVDEKGIFSWKNDEKVKAFVLNYGGTNFKSYWNLIEGYNPETNELASPYRLNNGEKQFYQGYLMLCTSLPISF